MICTLSRGSNHTINHTSKLFHANKIRLREQSVFQQLLIHNTVKCPLTNTFHGPTTPLVYISHKQTRSHFPSKIKTLIIFSISHKWTTERHNGLMIIALDSASTGPDSSPGQVIALCSCARHFTLTVPLSTQEYKWVPANCQGNLTKYWRATCDGLASHPGGVEISLVTSCYGNQDNPLASYDFTFFKRTCFVVRRVFAYGTGLTDSTVKTELDPSLHSPTNWTLLLGHFSFNKPQHIDYKVTNIIERK